VSLFTFGLIPASIGFAVLKYRLYDIDVVINKTVVFASLALFITAVYVAIVVGVGAIVGATNDPVLSAVAAAVVALAFQPVRRRAQRLADRVVYGKRATPYEVLSEFSDRLAGTYATEDLLPRMVRILAEGTGAARADVWVRAADTLRPAATWPTDAPALEPVHADTLPEDAIAVRHQGELLGALSVVKKPGESSSAQEDKLIADLASQAGLVLRNAGLTQELLARLEELQASRLRLVAAQDQERRKIERNLHDGAQQQLVALSVKLRLAEQLADRDTAKTKELLAQLQADTGDALETLRDLARGIYPPLLADKGLAAALESQVRRSPVPVRIEADGTGRYPQDAEAAVYFCCLEALQNVAKYANASQATVRLSDGDGALRFEVHDDGSGFDTSLTAYGTGVQGMADRLAALGGSIEIASSPGAGTTVTGTVPVPVRR
jgi:signal transduction histidine kinase